MGFEQPPVASAPANRNNAASSIVTYCCSVGCHILLQCPWVILWQTSDGDVWWCRYLMYPIHHRYHDASSSLSLTIFIVSHHHRKSVRVWPAQSLDESYNDRLPMMMCDDVDISCIRLIVFIMMHHHRKSIKVWLVQILGRSYFDRLPMMYLP